MLNYTNIKYCPHCASANIQENTPNSLLCGACGYVFFHNTACATVILLKHHDTFLFTRRGKDPGKGKLGLPGGFVDYNESAEEGILREIQEETALVVTDVNYYKSYPNTYQYRGVLYHTCDLYFTGTVDSIVAFEPNEEVTEIVCLKKHEIDIEQLAFESLRQFMKEFLK